MMLVPNRQVRSLLALYLSAWLLSCAVAGCASNNYLSVRKTPHNPLADPLKLFSRQGPRPSERTAQLLRRYDLATEQEKNSPVVLVSLEQDIAQEPSPEKIYSFAEIAYIDGKRAEAAGQRDLAFDLYGAAVMHSYLYLFDTHLDRFRNPYDPQFRQVCDLYNGSLEACLRIIKGRGTLRPGDTHRIKTARQTFDVKIVTRGPWHGEDFDKLEFVSDFEVKGLSNQYHTYGLGVPLIAVRKPHPKMELAERYYPAGLTFPVTAFLRVHRPSDQVVQVGTAQPGMHCTLELHDPLFADHLEVCNRTIPLETDLSTPLGYFLDSPSFKADNAATLGLLWPSSAQRLDGIYMVEPFSPHKIPVLMVHGLWSSPTTWMEMFNDLRALPEIRDKYQFWFYMYPTGQPFWISAAQLRKELDDLQRTLDPQRQLPALQQMVLVGHSMGGLVSKLQTIESRDDYWHVISNKNFADLKTDAATREKLGCVLYFQPNPNIRRVVTIGTPHRGSNFANDFTQLIGRKLIALPARMVAAGQQLNRDNPGFFKNTDLLTITTSIDSLSPNSPIFPVLMNSPQGPWVKQHNIVGLISDDGILGRFSESGDGVVPFQSAHLDEVESELVVTADHVNIHRHPRSVLEVRRILLEHLAETRPTPLTNAADTQYEFGNLGDFPDGFAQTVAESTVSPVRIHSARLELPRSGTVR